MKDGRRVIGLMSGTSCDGIDACLVDITGNGMETGVDLLAFETYAYDDETRKRIMDACQPETGTVDKICHLNFLLGHLFANAARMVAEKAGVPLTDVDLIGSHGQTIYHDPVRRGVLQYASTGSTLQIGEPCVIAQETGVTTVADFRARDIAAGGHGAPLVPYADFVLFRDENNSRAIQNIGGIANVTFLPKACNPPSSPVNKGSNPPLPPFAKGGKEEGAVAKGGKEEGAVAKEGMEEGTFAKGGMEEGAFAKKGKERGAFAKEGMEGGAFAKGGTGGINKKVTGVINKERKGGIYNGEIGEIIAFDTGPGNMIMDRITEMVTDGKSRFDLNGKLASSGRISNTLLDQLLRHPYFSKHPPKTTGREDFGVQFSDKLYKEAKQASLSDVDIMATVTAFTAKTIVEGYKRFIMPRHEITEVILCGGGAHNLFLVELIKEYVGSIFKIEPAVKMIDEFGIPGNAKEALAFAILANETISGIPNNVPSATGARKAVVLGKIVPGRWTVDSGQ